MITVKGGILILAVAMMGALTGCGPDMADQPKYKPYRASSFFEDGTSARPPVPGTVARGDLREDEFLYEGKEKGRYVTAFPWPVTEKVLKRGRQRYEIYCTVCHDGTGTGQGMIARRGFLPQPVSFHTDRLREMPVGYLYHVVSNGTGAMSDYADVLTPVDRWAVVAYVRALQYSQHAGLGDVPEDEREKLMKEKDESGKS